MDIYDVTEMYSMNFYQIFTAFIAKGTKSNYLEQPRTYALSQKYMTTEHLLVHSLLQGQCPQIFNQTMDFPTNAK